MTLELLIFRIKFAYFNFSYFANVNYKLLVNNKFYD